MKTVNWKIDIFLNKQTNKQNKQSTLKRIVADLLRSSESLQ